MKSHYDSQYRVLYEEISKIVRGDAENLTSTPEEMTKYGITTTADETASNLKGIPDYWKNVFKNCAFFPVNEKDEPILNHLSDVRMKPVEGSRLNFVMEFHFTPNEYFTNTLLTKTFFYNEETEDVEKTTGSSISWTTQDKNPRIKMKNKKVKKGKKVETIKQEEFVPSFFDLFADQSKEDYPSEEGNFFKDDLLPNSLEYYLNIMDEPMEGLDDFEEGEDEEDEDDEDEGKKKKTAAKPKKGGAKGAEGGEKCKNQ
jgi:hypothetical protein